MIQIIKKIFRRLRSFIEEKILIQFFRFIPIKDLIVFESTPDLSDNTKAVFDEMLRRELNKQYKLIWLLYGNSTNFPQSNNVEYFRVSDKSFKDRMIFLKLKMSAKCLISCNHCFPSLRQKQISIMLSHGTPIKQCNRYYCLPTSVNYCLAASPQTVSAMANHINYNPNQVVPLGFPRNDALITTKFNLHSLFNNNFKKIIVWYPTYRQHKSGGHNAHSSHSLPIIHDSEKAILLNDYLQQKNILIILKPHFAQNLDYIKDLNLTNLKFITESFFIENNITSYEFVGASDALITDYSSIYYDYTLCDKPIGAIWEDIEEYRLDPGFCIDIDFAMKGAEKIYNLDDFKLFLDHVSENQDILKKERNEIKAYSNISFLPDNAARVTDFIISKLN